MADAADRRVIFEEIFHGRTWGGVSKSGPGSDPGAIEPYIRWVSDWLSEHDDVCSILEVGCGDWSTTRNIDFGAKRTYLGIDIVEEMIEQNRRKYGNVRIGFDRADFVEEFLPPADLLLAKDVLQHLSNRSVSAFLARALRSYRYLILTNDIKKTKRTPLPLGLTRSRSITARNEDISDGGSRPLRLDIEPFCLTPIGRCIYDVVTGEPKSGMTYTKEILVCKGLARSTD